MKHISGEHSKIILKEMCRVVGITGKDFEDFDFEQPRWYWKHSWTRKEEDSFIVWLGSYLIKNKLVKKGRYKGQDNGYYQASKLVFSYGWRVKVP